MAMTAIVVVPGWTVVVEGLGAGLSGYNLPILHGRHHVLRRLAKVHAYRLSVAGRSSYLHFLHLLADIS
jgi:hypothetical protein